MIKNIFSCIIVALLIKELFQHIIQDKFPARKMFLSINDEYHKNNSVVLAKELNQEIESVVIVLNKRRKLQFDGFVDF